MNDIFFICPVFNELILNQRKIGVFEIDTNLYFPVKNLNQLMDIKTK